MRKSIWVFYRSEGGIGIEKDKSIREFLGEDQWYGSGIVIDSNERDNSFDWSPEIEARAVHLKNIGLIDRIQTFDPEQQAV